MRTPELNRCTDAERGRLLPLYESRGLTPEQILQFEEHLLECECCYQELVKSTEMSRLIQTHKPALRQHYAQTGQNFAAELEKLADSRAEANPTRMISSWIRSFSGWFAEHPQFQILLPSAAVAVIALFFVLNNPPELEERSGGGVESADKQVTESPADPLSDSEVMTDTPAFAEIDGKSAGEGGAQSELRSPPPAGDSQEESTVQRDPSPLVVSLLPKEPIPYNELTTRSAESSSTEAAFQTAMKFYSEKAYAKCATALRDLTAQNPNDAIMHKYLGSSLYMSGDPSGAVEALATAARLSARNGDARLQFYLAASLIKLSRNAEARVILTELTRDQNRIFAERAAALLRAIE